MGEYKVDWNADEIIVDGHKCKRLEEGVYAVQDEYMVDAYDWEMDKRNSGLRAFALYNGEDALQKIMIICKPIHICVVRGNQCMPKDKVNIALFCAYSEVDVDPIVCSML